MKLVVLTLICSIFMSTYETIQLSGDHFLIYTEFNTGNTGDPKLENEMCINWKKEAQPIMAKVKQYLEKELAKSIAGHGVNLIPYDNALTLVWEEESDRTSIENYRKSGIQACRYRMRFFDPNLGKSKNNEIPIVPKPIISRLDVEIAMKMLPEKEILTALKQKIIDLLSTVYKE